LSLAALEELRVHVSVDGEVSVAVLKLTILLSVVEAIQLLDAHFAKSLLHAREHRHDFNGLLVTSINWTTTVVDIS
jgi:hypothetical protein